VIVFGFIIGFFSNGLGTGLETMALALRVLGLGLVYLALTALVFTSLAKTFWE